jgi:spermidine synthase
MDTREPVEVTLQDARIAVETTPDDTYDLIVSDVFQNGVVPVHVATVEFAAEVARVLRDDGLYVVNVVDQPSLAFTRRLAASLCDVFHDVAVLSEPSMLSGRRVGNSVLVAAGQDRKLPEDALTTLRTGESAQVRLVRGGSLTELVDGAEPMRD